MNSLRFVSARGAAAFLVFAAAAAGAGFVAANLGGAGRFGLSLRQFELAGPAGGGVDVEGVGQELADRGGDGFEFPVAVEGFGANFFGKSGGGEEGQAHQGHAEVLVVITNLVPDRFGQSVACGEAGGPLVDRGVGGEVVHRFGQEFEARGQGALVLFAALNDPVVQRHQVHKELPGLILVGNPVLAEDRGDPFRGWDHLRRADQGEQETGGLGKVEAAIDIAGQGGGQMGLLFGAEEGIVAGSGRAGLFHADYSNAQ